MSDLLFTTAPIELQAGGDGSKPERGRAVVYDGTPMVVGGWSSPVVVDLAGADVSGTIPILADHRSSLDDLAGQGEAQIKGGKIVVEFQLTEATPAGQKVLAIARDGISLQASIGYTPATRETFRAGEKVSVNGRTIEATSAGLVVVRTGKLREVSLLPVGACPDTHVEVAAKQRRNTAMADNQVISDNGAELERIQALWSETTWHFSDGPRERAEAAMLAASAGRMSVSDFEKALLTERQRDSELAFIRVERPTPPSPCCGKHTAVSNSEPRVLEAALLRHMGYESLAEKTLGEQTMTAAASFRPKHLLDIFAAGVQLDGREVPSSKDGLIRAAFSTHSLTGILGNAANKISLNAYQAYPSVARMIARKLTAGDFKAHTGYRLTGGLGFEQVGNAGTIHHGTVAESSYSYSVSTYARMLSLTRQDIINDDLGAFAEIPAIIGRGAATKLESVFWTLVLANTGSFFSSGNGNLVTTSALGINGLGSAVSTMRKLTDNFGEPIAVQPKFLLVPPELEATADQLFTSTNLLIAPDAAANASVTYPDGNPYRGKFQPLVSPYLSNSSYTGYIATSWYLFGAATDVAAFGIAYLNGQESPTIESAEADFNTLGMQWRGYLDFGVCQVDKHGAVKATA